MMPVSWEVRKEGEETPEYCDGSDQEGPHNEDEENELEEEEEEDLEYILTGQFGEGKGNQVDDENYFYDSDYTVDDELDVEREIQGCQLTSQVGAPPQGQETSLRGELVQAGGADVVDSDQDDSGDLMSCSSTDSEQLLPTKPSYAEFNEETDMSNPEFAIGMKFRDFKQFKEAVKNYGIKHRYVMNFRPNTKSRCKAYCKRGCPFYLWAAPMIKDKNTVQIKSGVLKHECGKEHKNRHVSAKWIARKYFQQFKADPSWKLAGIIQAVKTNQQVEITRLTAYRAKCIAIREIDGDEESQMRRLYDYRLELINTHPGSTVKFRCDQGVFEAMYVCLSPLKNGFLVGCRRIISIDGCFLKGLYGGQLLSAVGIDANNSLYPIAWAVVNRENRENWVWFLQLLAEDLSIINSEHWAFMSDRQKGLINAVEELFPYSEL